MCGSGALAPPLPFSCRRPHGDQQRLQRPVRAPFPSSPPCGRSGVPPCPLCSCERMTRISACGVCVICAAYVMCTCAVCVVRVCVFCVMCGVLVACVCCLCCVLCVCLRFGSYPVVPIEKPPPATPRPLALSSRPRTPSSTISCALFFCGCVVMPGVWYGMCLLLDSLERCL